MTFSNIVCTVWRNWQSVFFLQYALTTFFRRSNYKFDLVKFNEIRQTRLLAIYQYFVSACYLHQLMKLLLLSNKCVLIRFVCSKLNWDAEANHVHDMMKWRGDSCQPINSRNNNKHSHFSSKWKETTTKHNTKQNYVWKRKFMEAVEIIIKQGERRAPNLVNRITLRRRRKIYHATHTFFFFLSPISQYQRVSHTQKKTRHLQTE